MRFSFLDISDEPQRGVLLKGAMTKNKGARSDRRSLLSLGRFQRIAQTKRVLLRGRCGKNAGTCIQAGVGIVISKSFGGRGWDQRLEHGKHPPGMNVRVSRITNVIESTAPMCVFMSSTPRRSMIATAISRSLITHMDIRTTHTHAILKGIPDRCLASGI